METTAPPEPVFDIQPGDVLISASEGVRIARGSEIMGRAVTDPTEFALAIPDGRVVYQAPPDGVYPDYWPTAQVAGDPALFIVSPDGSVETLYSGGGSIRMFDLIVIPEVNAGPAVVAMRRDPLADGTHVESLVIIPVDGSPAFVVADVPSHVTGAAWLDGFFAIAVNEESGTSYVVAVGLDGEQRVWPLNPEPIGDRDESTRVTTLTRIGGTTLIAYSVASGGFWEGSTDLVIYDTAAGEVVTTIDIGIPWMVVTALHASDDLLAISKVYETGDHSASSLIHVPITVYDTHEWSLVPRSIPGGGTYSVVTGG